MVPSPTPVLIAAAPGPLRVALQALLLSLPWVEAVYMADELSGLLEILPAGLPSREVLMVLILEAGQTWPTSINAIHQIFPAARVAILTDDSSQAAADDLWTEKSPATLILQQGTRPESLIAGFERLLVGDATGG